MNQAVKVPLIDTILRIVVLKSNLSYFPDNFPKTELTLFGQHLYSVMISILFSRKSNSDQLQMLNKIYPYKLTEKNIDLYLDSHHEYLEYVKSDLVSISEKNNDDSNLLGRISENDPGILDWDSSDEISKELFVLQQDLYSKRILSPAIDICQIALQKMKNSKDSLCIQFKDALATIYREMGDYSHALVLFREVREFWESEKNQYQIFLGLKNEAYCYGKLGESSYSTILFDKIEGSLEKFLPNELGPVYQNLGIRYHFLKNFQKEYHFFQLAMKYLPTDSSRYYEVKKSIEIIEYCKIKDSAEIDFAKLNQIYRNLHFEEFLGKFQENRDKLIPNIAEGFLNLAYDWMDEKTNDFYLEMIDLAVMESDYGKIDTLLHKLDREQYPFPYLYGSGILNLHRDDITEFWEILHQLDFIAYTNFTDCKDILKKEIDWSVITNPTSRNEIITAIENRCISQIDKDGFSEYEKSFEKSKDNLLTKMASGILSRLQFFYLAWNSKEKRDKWFTTRIDMLRKSFNSADLELLTSFKNIFKERRDWVNYETLVNLFLEFKPNFITIGEAGNYHYLIKKDYMTAINIYKKGLDLKVKTPRFFEILIELYSLIEDFESAGIILDQISKTDFKEPKLSKTPEEWKKFIERIKNSRIRYKLITNQEIIKILKTLEFQITQFFVHHGEFDFSILYTLFSKLLEKTLVNGIGHEIYNMLKGKYQFPDQVYQSQPGRIDRYFKDFLVDPSQYAPVLGNWKFIFKGYCESYVQENQIYIDIHEYLNHHQFYTREKLQLILDLIESFKDERNDGTHSKLFSFDEIYKKLGEIIPLLNQYLDFIGKYSK